MTWPVGTSVQTELDALHAECVALRSRLAEAEALLLKAEQNEILLVEKLDEAEALLRETQAGTYYLHPSWFDRRDAFLGRNKA